VDFFTTNRFFQNRELFFPKICRDSQPKRERETLMVLLERIKQITIPNVKLQRIGK